MKKLLPFAFVAALALPLCAADVIEEEEETGVIDAESVPVRQRKQVAQWPVFFAFCDFPESPDVIGLRLTIPFATKQESITGFDLGFWGRANYFEGFMLNLIRNDVKDNFAGVQAGIYNSIGRGETVVIQAGLWNEAMCFRGAQVGLVNTVGEGEGFQVGLINRAETLYGLQLGLINVIRDNELTFFPLVNIGF